MSEETIAEEERKTRLQKITEVAEKAESADIRMVDRSFAHFDIHTIHLNGNPFFSPHELLLDMQNVPKWKRIVFNWGNDIAVSLSWATAWAERFEAGRRMFEAENGQSEFSSFSKSDHFDGEAWHSSRYYTDNAIFRMHSYKEKIAWMLNSHSKLRLLDPSKPDEKMSFGKYRGKAKERPELKALHEILTKHFTFRKAGKITTFYRNQFTHNETPVVDWPKEGQAEIVRKHEGEKLVYESVPFLALSPPDFESDVLRQDAIDVWEQFVEGTNRLDEYLNETYYSKMSSGKQTTP